jgi:hypothetical protein
MRSLEGAPNPRDKAIRAMFPGEIPFTDEIPDTPAKGVHDSKLSTVQQRHTLHCIVFARINPRTSSIIALGSAIIELCGEQSLPLCWATARPDSGNPDSRNSEPD